MCGKFGHSAKICRNYKIFSIQELVANLAQISGSANNQNWVMDSGALNHVTNDLNNLSLYFEYRGPDEILVGNGSSLKITHNGSTQITIT